MTLANTWSRIYSPHIIKLCGFTLTTPYTMVMEYSKYGPLNEFLAQQKNKVSLRQLLDVVHGLVRGIVYLVRSNTSAENILKEIVLIFCEYNCTCSKNMTLCMGLYVVPICVLLNLTQKHIYLKQRSLIRVFPVLIVKMSKYYHRNINLTLIIFDLILF